MASWLDPNDLNYEPEVGGLFILYETRRSVLGGIACAKLNYVDGAPTGLDDEYLLIEFDGSVEFGFSPARIRDESRRIFRGGKLVRRLWQTLSFVADVRSRLGILAPHMLAVNLRNTEGVVLLAGFASRCGVAKTQQWVPGWISRTRPDAWSLISTSGGSSLHRTSKW